MWRRWWTSALIACVVLAVVGCELEETQSEPEPPSEPGPPVLIDTGDENGILIALIGAAGTILAALIGARWQWVRRRNRARGGDDDGAG